jgi:integrase-like protein
VTIRHHQQVSHQLKRHPRKAAADDIHAHLSRGARRSHQQRGAFVRSAFQQHLAQRFGVPAAVPGLPHHQLVDRECAAAGLSLVDDAYMFAASIDGSVPLKPHTVTQRYKRLVTKLGISTLIKLLRHYSATELLTGGVDLRTVAGWLGHGGGGTTTLKVYAAWASAADQRAALITLDRMLARPVPGGPVGGGFAADDPLDEMDPQRGYVLIAADIRTKDPRRHTARRFRTGHRQGSRRPVRHHRVPGAPGDAAGQELGPADRRRAQGDRVRIPHLMALSYAFTF